MKKVLTIAGSDCSGGAGIQADLKTMSAFGVYGMSVITALTAQNTTGVYGIFETTPEFTANQLDCVFTDIMPDGVKIGMVSGKELIDAAALKLMEYKPPNIVIDPVMVSTSQSRLLKEDAIEILENKLLPLAHLITPNIPEAEILWGQKIKGNQDMEEASKVIGNKFQTAVLVKGGHHMEDANDVLFCQGNIRWFYGKRVKSSNTHGTGCTLSSAIACGLAEGISMEDSITRAKEYVARALKANLNLGKGNGPLNHCVEYKR